MTALAIILGLSFAVAVLVVVVVEMLAGGDIVVHDEAPTVDDGWRGGV